MPESGHWRCRAKRASKNTNQWYGEESKRPLPGKVHDVPGGIRAKLVARGQIDEPEKGCRCRDKDPRSHKLLLHLIVLAQVHASVKGRDGDHSELGADLALEICPRLGLTPEETETVSWLVRHHLLMSKTAFRYDLNDPKTIDDFAAIVQSPERLKLLLVLTVADIRGVGPTIWNGWKAALMRDLYYQTDAVLRGADAAVIAAGNAEAAKQAGVTPAAVYRHFEGRDDLIAEVALEGYKIFADLMQFAYDKGQPSALAAFEATGRAYLAFARRYPGYYISMFESGISVNRTPELAAVSSKARGILEQAAEDLGKHIPKGKRPPASMFSAHILAMSHGVVELFARNSPGTASPYSPEELLETGIGVYLRGLGILEKDI